MNIRQRTVLALCCSFAVSAILVRFVFLDQTPRLQAHDISRYPGILARSVNSALSGAGNIIPSLLSMRQSAPAPTAVPTWALAPTGTAMGFTTVPTVLIPTAVATVAQNNSETTIIPSTQPSTTPVPLLFPNRQAPRPQLPRPSLHPSSYAPGRIWMTSSG